MTIDLTQRRNGEVARAKRAFDAIAAKDPFGHIKLKRELVTGNPYAEHKLALRGCVYDRKRGAIVSALTTLTKDTD